MRPDPVDWQQLACAKRLRHLRLEPMVQEEAGFVVFDCFRQRLRAAGLVLLGFEDQLWLIGGAEVLVAHAPLPETLLVADLPKGPLRDRVEALCPLRRLLPLAQGQLDQRALQVLDKEGKTHLRGMELLLQTKAAGQPLVSVLHLVPLRGYHKTAFALSKALVSQGAGAFSAKSLLKGVGAPPRPKSLARLIRPEPADTGFDLVQRGLSQSIAVARRNEAGVVQDFDVKFLHEYRVALRKARSVLSLFKGALGDALTVALAGRLAAVVAPTGRLRDLDVFLLEEHAYRALVPEGLQPGLDVAFDAVRRERQMALAQVARYFQSPAYLCEIESLATLLGDPQRLVRGPAGAKPAQREAARRIWKRYGKVCKLAGGIDAMTPDEDVHELRIECKKLRYLMEFTRPFFPREEVDALLLAMKDLQDCLGLFNDCCVQQEALQGWLNAPEGPLDAQAEGGRPKESLIDDPKYSMAAAKSIGALLAVLAARQQAARDEVVAQFARFNSKATQKQFKSLFKTGGGPDDYSRVLQQ